MIVFVHLEDEVSQLLSFLVSIPDATDASSQNALSRPAAQCRAKGTGKGGKEYRIDRGTSPRVLDPRCISLRSILSGL